MFDGLEASSLSIVSVVETWVKFVATEVDFHYFSVEVVEVGLSFEELSGFFSGHSTGFSLEITHALAFGVIVECSKDFCFVGVFDVDHNLR